MALKTYNPTTPSQRQLVTVDRSTLWKGKPVKGLTEGKSSTGGRNNNGRITSRFRGGGHKRAYRKVDFCRTKLDVPATVERLEYDPNRTAFIALVRYADGEQAYILAPQRLAAGDSVIAGAHVDVLARDDRIARGKTLRRQDVIELAIRILDQRNEPGAVGIVFDTLDGRSLVELAALEIDGTQRALVTAAAETHGDAAVVVAAAGADLALGQRLHRRAFMQTRAIDDDQLSLTGRRRLE